MSGHVDDHQGTEREIRRLCWIGVVIDAIAAIAFALPARSRLRRLILPAVGRDHTEHAAGSRSVAPLMAGWTVLLAWVAREPIARRLPLLLTSAPVVAGLMAVEVVDVSQRRSSAKRLSPTFALQTILLVVFVRAYLRSRRVATADSHRS